MSRLTCATLFASLLVFTASACSRAKAQAPAPAPAAVPTPAPAPAPAPAAPQAQPTPVLPPVAAPPPGAPAAPAPAPEAAKPGAKGKPQKPVPSAYEVLFTFDDGPRLDTTPQVLDTLAQYGVKAVFFVNGVRFAGKGKERDKARELMRETVRRGHIIGNHTVHHKFLCGKLGPTIGEREITENAQLITEAIGQPPQLFRTPYGSHCASLSLTLKKLNLHPIGWDVDPQDWKLQDADKIYEFMVQALRSLRRPRSILLFHDVQPATVAMLPRLLKWIQDENAARRARKQPEIKIIDYSYLLATNPPGLAAPSRPG